jgi:hypothetical protein
MSSPKSTGSSRRFARTTANNLNINNINNNNSNGTPLKKLDKN